MTYHVIKKIGKYQYLYEQTSYREGGKVKSKCRSLGRLTLREWFQELGPVFPTAADRAEDKILDDIAKDRKAEESAKASPASPPSAGAPAPAPTSQDAPSAPDASPPEPGQPSGQSDADGGRSTS